MRLLLVGLAVVMATVLSGCPAVIPIATGVIDVVDAVCTQAEKQPEPQWVYFVCTVAGAPPSVATQYTMRVPANSAKEFAAAHAFHG